MEMDISDIVEEIKQAYDFAYENYSVSTNLICSNSNASEEEIERFLDLLLGYCEDDRILDLYKKVCRTFYYKYPELIEDHILMYKDMYEQSN